MDETPLDISRHLAANADTVTGVLGELLADEIEDGEVFRPAQLMAAIRHGVLNGGKRLRPFLVMESTRLLGGKEDAALRVAAALECLHCYSLIHDDLPAMDDDAVRRGQPTVHVAFDDATAILAGDALQTLAFDIIASEKTRLPAETKVQLVAALARAAGVGGMVGGQALDLAAETTRPDEAGILTLQAMKTGALIRFACEAGAIVAAAPREDRERLRCFGGVIGLAFQLADDLLDVTASAEDLGKATGKDAEHGKATLVALKGIGWARRRLDELVEEAAAMLLPYGSRARTLVAAARFIADRRN